MARLVCAACRQPPGDGKNCQHCSRSLAEPGATIDLDAAPAAAVVLPSRPVRTHEVDLASAVVAPALGPTCSEPGCNNPRATASLLCAVHSDLRSARQHQDYSLRCTRGFIVDVPDGTTVTLGTSPEHSTYAEHLRGCHFVSRKHASVTSRGGALTIVDLGSRNGTVVAGVELEPGTPKVLVPGDQVMLGHEVALYVR